MDISSTPIWEEVSRIMDADPSEGHARWRCELLIDGEVITPQQLVSIETVRQYVSTFADQTVICVQLLRSVLYHRVLPFKDDFKVTLYKEPVKEITTGEDYEREQIVRTYRGILVDAHSEKISGTVQAVANEEDADRLGFEQVDIQLVDLALEQLQMKTVGGIYRGMTTTEAVRGTLTRACGELNLDDAASVQGIDMVEGMNETVRDHIIVPSGTRVVDFPKYVQEHAGGIYGSGIGYYLQNGIWYVYPEFNVRRFERTPKTMTVFNIPPDRFPGVERTYIKDDDRLLILATGKTQHMDETESNQLTQGNGVRFANADRLLENYRTIKSNRVTFERDKNVEEFIVKPRRAGLNQTPMSPRRITANPYHELSELTKRVGSIVQFQWQHADVDQIYPGMPVRYVYIEDDAINEIYGIVLGADHLVSVQGAGMANANNYVCEAVVRLFLESGE